MAGILIANNSEILKPDEQSESKCLTANKSCNYT